MHRSVAFLAPLSLLDATFFFLAVAAEQDPDRVVLLTRLLLRRPNVDGDV